MSKIINISDKLSNEKPAIQVGEKLYPINDGVNVVMRFEELASTKSVEGMIEAMELTLGKEAVRELGIEKYSISNFQVMITGLLAAMQGITYEDAAGRFRQ